MKRICILLLIAFISSCRTIVPLQGKYQELPVKSKFNYSTEKVWETVIDFISDTGQEVQVIDKSSGLVISALHVGSGPVLSNEDKKGAIVNPLALVATERYNDQYPQGDLPTFDLFAKWTIRIKELPNKEVEVSTLLHVKDIQQIVAKDVLHYRGKSTGNFEKSILDNLSDRLDITK